MRGCQDYQFLDEGIASAISEERNMARLTSAAVTLALPNLNHAEITLAVKCPPQFNAEARRRRGWEKIELFQASTFLDSFF